MNRARLGVLVLAAGLALAGCSSSESTDAAPATSAELTTEPTPAPDFSQPMTIGVTLSDGSVDPVNAQLTSRVGQPIVLLVDSDTTDELHVHATPEHTFPVEAAQNQRFEFVVEVPGRVEIELHGAHRTVATILVAA
ncbi:hypothetical protein IU433_03410 [Nocardia puris]|uniref:EfeO-type cupredoxin-like domain-containing protein n=1 Tax=Nocardia puris TaxID=208602 RepID=A0A366DWF9_9NOCA|nr:hypothetical protein [Nocardia puris]MBF6209999.1 hypothetical protein [Nocardia puris]MBF6368190.1 hypothetical protein [Nocardia puris]MBF6458091.1 hypothetical protein [Nocardia puris]RBO94255.1 hypothetical protein DFR74_102678 [Nocardia puris]